MSRTVLGATTEGLKKRLDGHDRAIADLNRRGDWQFDTETDPESASSLLRNDAHLLVLSATGDSIAASGDTINFGAIVTQHGFNDVVSAGGSWAHPISGVYMLTVKLEWQEYWGGGTIQLLIDDVPVSGGVLVSGSGSEAFGVLPYKATAGSAGSIRVTHPDAAAQTCDALVAVAITDPDVVEAPGDEWEQLFAADAWGITHDGTDWWVTEGDSGLTVSRLDDAGTVLSSWEASVLGDSVHNRVRGIAWDPSSGLLWMNGGRDARVAGYARPGGLSTTLDLSWSEEGDAGVGFDGTYLWVVGGDTKELRRYSTGGSLQHIISLGAGSYADCTVYNSTVYVVDRGNTQLRTFAFNGTEGAPVDLSSAPINPTGVWIAADGTLYLSLDANGVYRWNGGTL